MSTGPLRSRLAVPGASVLLGIVAALGLAPFDAWWAALPALAAVGWLFQSAQHARGAAQIGWFFGLGYFTVGLMWIVEPFLVDAERHGWMAPFGLFFMAGGLALFWAAGFWAGHVLGRGPGSRTLALLAAWSLAEFGRAYLLSGFPWAALAQIWTATDAALLLAWVGPHGLALWTLAATLPLPLLLTGMRARSAVLVPGVALAASALAASQTAGEAGETGRIVRLVQPNAPQHQKWHPDHVWTFFERKLALTAARDPARPVDLIVWPETSIPPLLGRAGEEIAAISAAAGDVPVVAGIRRAENGRLYNSLIVIGPNGALGGLYDKHHLVPFGEYVPLGDLAARFGIYGFAAGRGEGFSGGPGPELLSLGALGRALPLICYEAVFPQDVNGAPDRPDLLLQITNDAWFGSWSGPYQHLAQARMRAIEQGVPMIRVANTGVSAMIDPLGRIVDALPLNEAGALDAPLPRPLPPTLYARTGDWPAFGAVLALMIVLAAIQFARRRTI